MRRCVVAGLASREEHRQSAASEWGATCTDELRKHAPCGALQMTRKAENTQNLMHLEIENLEWQLAAAKQQVRVWAGAPDVG